MNIFSSLTNRIFLASAALTVVAIAIAVYRVNVAVTAQAENELRRGIDEAGSCSKSTGRRCSNTTPAKAGSSPTCRT